MRQNIETHQPYKVCKFLGENRPTTFTSVEIAAAVGLSKPGTDAILRKLVQEKIVFIASTCKPGSAKKSFTYSTHGNAAQIYALYRERVLSEKSEQDKRAPHPQITKSYIMAAFHAHPLHEWRGVH